MLPSRTSHTSKCHHQMTELPRTSPHYNSSIELPPLPIKHTSTFSPFPPPQLVTPVEIMPDKYAFDIYIREAPGNINNLPTPDVLSLIGLPEVII